MHPPFCDIISKQVTAYFSCRLNANSTNSSFVDAAVLSTAVICTKEYTQCLQ